MRQVLHEYTCTPYYTTTVNIAFLLGTCVNCFQQNVVGNWWYLYWAAASLLLKLLIPTPICLVCVLLAIWGIGIARTKRNALIHNSTSKTNDVSGGHQHSTTGGGVGLAASETKAMQVLCGIYFFAQRNKYNWIYVACYGTNFVCNDLCGFAR